MTWLIAYLKAKFLVLSLAWIASTPSDDIRRLPGWVTEVAQDFDTHAKARVWDMLAARAWVNPEYELYCDEQFDSLVYIVYRRMRNDVLPFPNDPLYGHPFTVEFP